MTLSSSAYYFTSSKLLGESGAYGLDSLRAIICQARYLLSKSKMSSAYSKVCTGVGIAFNLGLHVSGASMEARFSAEEQYQRRRVFATLNMMDTYLSSLLGLPKNVKTSNPELILGLRDEDIADLGKRSVERNPYTAASETLLCQKLNDIIAKMHAARSALKDHPVLNSEQHYEEDLDWVSQRADDLDQWNAAIQGSAEEPPDLRALHAQLTLRLWHSLAQVVLYRPFLHHLSRKPRSREFNMRGYECGSGCVRAAMQAIYIVEALYSHNILSDGYYVVIYMLTSAASILSFFLIWTTQRATLEESKSALARAKELLALLARNSDPASRCLAVLRAMPEEHIDGMSRDS